MMREFHVVVHARPREIRLGKPVTVDGRSLATLASSPDALAESSFPVSFDALCNRFAAIPRMFVEPDGSFVQVSCEGSLPWQLNGNFIDRAGSVTHVELKGNCPREDLRQLLRSLGLPSEKLLFQLVREGVLVANTEFFSYVYE